MSTATDRNAAPPPAEGSGPGPSVVRAQRAHAVTDPRLVQAARAVNGPDKRRMDVVGAGLALAVLAPVALMTWPLVRLLSGGPVFAWSAVVGRQGRQFQRLSFHPRFTAADATGFNAAFGRLLRASGVGALPQIVNVLTGEMSLVGPEPVTRDALDDYAVGRRYYLLVRPGVTSLYRVRRARGRVASRAASDREYIMAWSVGNDLSILKSAVYLAIFRPHLGEAAAGQPSGATLLSQSSTRD